MRPKPIRLFSRAVMTLLMMLLTTASAWAFKTETTTYRISCTSGQFHIYAGTSETDSWKGSLSGTNIYWEAKEGHKISNNVTITPNQNVYYSTVTTVGIHTTNETKFTFKAPNSIAITNVVFKNGSSVVSSTNSESGSTYTVTLAANTSFNGFEVTFGTISGKCGDNANWTLSKQDGQYTKLTISGSGAMTNEYGHETVNGLWRTDAPWDWQDLKSVTIENGITSIGQYAFIGCEQLSSLSIGSSVTTIGTNAFDHCDELTEVTLPASVTSIGEQCFKNCGKLQRVNIQHDGAISLGSNVFQNCGKLQYIVFSNPAAALDNTTGNWSGLTSKLRVALGTQLFTATNQGGTAAYKIASDDDLRNLAAAVNAGNVGNGQTFRQTGDITLSSTNFEPIAARGQTSFRGTYDGGGYTISNLHISYLDGIVYYGLFADVYYGTVKNVRLVNPIVDGGNNIIGALIGREQGSTVQNCVVINPTIEGSGYKGAIIGSINGGTLQNLYFYDDNLTNAIGIGSCGTNVGRVRKVILSSGIASVSPAINPTATSLDNGFVYDNALYYREGLVLTLANNLSASTGKHVVYKAAYNNSNNTLTGNTYTVSSTDVTLTAEQAYNTYTVKFYANGGSGSMSNQVFTYGTAQNLTTNAFTRTGYTFAGWATSANGNVVYDDKESVNNLTTTNGGTVNLYAQWTANTYTVTFKMQGGNGGSESATATYDAAMPAITVPERTGYTFGGYYTEANGGGTQYYNADGTSAKKWNLTAATTLYAKWTANTYTVTFKMQGGNGGSESATATYDAAMPAITVPERTGYTFGGYYTEANGGGTQYYNADGTSANNWIIAEATPLYAQWTANTYTVTFEIEGGNGGSESATATYDAAMPAITVPTRTGYTFGGYYTEENGGGTQYYNADGTSANNWIIAEATPLYAQWTANTYTVTFEIEGGNGGSESATATYDAAMPAITVPTRTGYTFGGYYTETNGGGTQYYNADGTSANNWIIAEATTLYAQWTANTYTVAFNANGGSGSMSDQTFTYDEAQNLTANAFTRTGCIFAGWATSANGDVVYSDQQSVSNLTTENNGTVTLYAKWDVPYIDADGNTQYCSNFTVLTNSTDISNLSKGWYVVAEDVSYSSWFRCGSGDIHLILCDNAKMTVEINNNSEAIRMGYGSLTIYAQSTGSSMGKLIATSTNDGSIDVTGNVTICGGNIIATGDNGGGRSGIYANGNITIHSGQVSASGTYGILANGTITLGLRNVTDYITASSYEGTVNIAGGQTLIDGTAFYTGNNVSIPGGKTLALPVAVTLADDITGTTGIVEIGGNKYAKAGATVTISVTAPEGYAFSGNITVSPTVDVTDNGNGTYSFIMSEETVTVTHDAKWTANTYTVMFNGNGGTCGDGEMSDMTFTYDEAQNLTANVFTRTGYTFAGWATSTDGNVVYTDQQSVSNLITTNGGSVTLYAQWTANTYTVTLNNQSATTTGSESATATYDAAMPAITVPTRTGYTFGGYYTEENGGGTQYYNADGTSANNWIIAEATTLYAKWTANTYTVTFNGNGNTDGSMSDQSFTYDVEQALTANAFTRALTVSYDYNGATGGNSEGSATTTATFDGWAKSADGAKVYDDGQLVSNLTTEDHATVNLYAKWTDGSVTLPTPTKTGYTFAGWYSDSKFNTRLGDAGESFTPSEDITLYAKWGIPYIDADGNTQTCSNFTVLTNSTNISNLSAGWYVVAEDVSYSSQFFCISGDIHLILCDGAKMTVESNSDNAIGVLGYSLTIYAQSTGSSMGQLVATASNEIGILAGGSITICGGNITATGNDFGISAVGSVTICGGNITATGNNIGISAYNNITIHSGQVSASGDFGILANDTITLGVRNATDYITASSYNKNVNIADGQTLTDGTAAYSGNNVSITGNKTLQRAVPITLADGITATTGITESGNNKYAKAGATVTISVAREGYAFSGNITITPTVDVTDNGNGTYSFTMPEEAVTVTHDAKWTLATYTITYHLNGGTLETSKNNYTMESDDITLDTPTLKGCTFLGWYTNSYLTGTPVTSIDHGSTGNVELWARWSIPYIDADGNTQTCSNFTVLTNSMNISNLSTGWYVVAEDVSYSSRFRCTRGDIRLILCDNAKMTVESNSDNAIGVLGYSLTIYAQSTGSSMGQLVATASNYDGINATGDITICGGNITATGSHGIYTQFGGVTIHSGQVNASGATYGITVNDGTITLGVRNATDYITASSYNKNVNIADGQAFTDEDGNIYSGNNVSIPRGKTLRPIPVLELSDNADNTEVIREAAAASTGGSLYNVILSGRTLYKDGGWNTICLPFNVTLADSPLAGATAKTLETASLDDGTLTLNFGDDVKELTAGTPYIIRWEPADLFIDSTADWETFATNVNNGTESYEGKVVKLRDDISITTMAGTYTHPFKGTFDGQGHKLTVTLNNNDDSDMGTSEQYQGVAPFRFTSGATIMNLTVDGTVSTTNRKFAAGFIGWALESTNNIQNCTSSVEIYSTINGDGTHGGFVGKASGTLNITNSLFNGMMTTTSSNRTNSCGGFVGWAEVEDEGVIIKNSLYAPATIPNGKYKISTNNSATFARNGATINKGYYTETFGDIQGTSTHGITGSGLKKMLGSGWQVKDGKAVPVTTTIDLVNPVFIGVTIDDTDRPVTSKDDKVSFKGTYAPINWTVETPSILFVGEKNQLHWPLAGAHLNACRAYFELADGEQARSFNLNFGEETSDIVAIDNSQFAIDNSQLTIHNEADAWYDMQGRKVNGKPTKKGLYIHNGRKVVVK